MNANPKSKQNEGFWYNVLSVVVVLASLVLGWLAYPRLPAQVPTHWNLAGQVDGYSSPFMGAFMMPLLVTAILALMWLVPKIDPKRDNYLKMGRVYSAVRFYIILLLAAMHLAILGAALGYGDITPHLVSSGVGLLFIIIGNYFGKVKYNYTFGIKTPWTLANEQVWYRTHRAMGPLWMVGGIFMAAASFVPLSLRMPLFILSLVILVIVPFAYSYLIFRQLEDDQK